MSWNVIAQAMGLDRKGALRNALASAWSRLGLGRLTERTPPHRTVAFTIAVTMLAAKMAKADGVALPVEAKAFERTFNIPDAEAANIRRVYNLAKRDVAGFDIYAGKIAGMLQQEPCLLRSVLECLFYIAAADGVLHPDEDRFLDEVGQIFAMPRLEYLAIRASFVHDPASPYAILGIAPDASDEELKARHRELVREHHPDRLAASGIPAEFRSAADRRLAAINAAYDTVLKERNEAREEPRKERCS